MSAVEWTSTPPRTDAAGQSSSAPNESLPAPSEGMGGASMRPGPADAVDVSMTTVPADGDATDGMVIQELPATKLHPRCRLEGRGPSAKQKHVVAFRDGMVWSLAGVECDKCATLLPASAFCQDSRWRAVRRVKRALHHDKPAPRGKGGIRCRTRVLTWTPPKSLVLAAIQAGRVRGRVSMQLLLELPSVGRGLWLELATPRSRQRVLFFRSDGSVVFFGSDGRGLWLALATPRSRQSVLLFRGDGSVVFCGAFGAKNPGKMGT